MFVPPGRGLRTAGLENETYRPRGHECRLATGVFRKKALRTGGFRMRSAGGYAIDAV